MVRARSLVISSCFRGFRTRSKTVGFEIAFIVDLSSRDRSVAPAAFGARSEQTVGFARLLSWFETCSLCGYSCFRGSRSFNKPKESASSRHWVHWVQKVETRIQNHSRCQIDKRLPVLWRWDLKFWLDYPGFGPDPFEGTVM